MIITPLGLIVAVVVAYLAGLVTPIVWAYLQFLHTGPGGGK